MKSTRVRTAMTAAVAWVLGACGARTELDVDPVVASLPDAAPPDVRIIEDAAADAPVEDVVLEPRDPIEEVRLGSLQSVCVRRASGTVDCWGGRVVNYGPAPGQPIEGVRGATSICAGNGYGCALVEGGTVSCWGRNDDGVLGDGTRESRSYAAPVVGVRDVVELACSAHYPCARTATGDVLCWGPAWWGEVVGPTTARRVRLPAPARSIAVSPAAGCARLDDNSVWCWGRRAEFGQYALIIHEFGLDAVDEPALRAADHLAAGVAASFCGRRNGAPWVCTGWCENLPSNGLRCRDGSSGALVWSPVRDTEPLVSLGLGYRSGCGLTETGQLYCWNSDVALGPGTGIPGRNASPVLIPFERVIQVAGGAGYGGQTTNQCVVTASRQLWCWGDGVRGREGERLLVPTRIPLRGER